MKKIIYALFGAFALYAPSIYAQAAESDMPPSRDQGFTQTLVMMAIAIMFFYFILWRPEQKRRKTLEQQRSAMKVGDRVQAMGIIGTIAKINENTVILKMVDGNKVEFMKSAIAEVLGNSEEAPSSK